MFFASKVVDSGWFWLMPVWFRLILLAESQPVLARTIFTMSVHHLCHFSTETAQMVHRYRSKTPEKVPIV